MNGLIVAFFATLAVTCASPSGLGLGLGLGWGVGPSAVIVPSRAATVVSRPLGLGLGLGVPGLGLGVPGLGLAGPGLGLAGPGLGLGVPALGLGVPALAPWGLAPAALSTPVLAPVAPAGAVAVTNGGGVVQVSGHGAAVTGPKTAPVVIEGPSGVVKADGLWGPTLAGVLH